MIVHSRAVSGDSTAIVEGIGPIDSALIVEECREFDEFIAEKARTYHLKKAYNAAFYKWNTWIGSREEADYVKYVKYCKARFFIKDGQYYKYGVVRITEGKATGKESVYPAHVMFDYGKFLEDNYNWIGDHIEMYKAKEEERSSKTVRRSGGFNKFEGGEF